MKKQIFPWKITEHEGKTDLGSIKIQNDCIATIASIAATKIDGVAHTGSTILTGIKSLISRKTHSQGVYIEFTEENELKISIYIIAKYGANIPQLANKVQTNVHEAVERMTGISPVEVNVVIQDVQTEESKREVKNAIS